MELSHSGSVHGPSSFLSISAPKDESLSISYQIPFTSDFHTFISIASLSAEDFSVTSFSLSSAVTYFSSNKLNATRVASITESSLILLLSVSLVPSFYFCSFQIT